MEELEQSSYKKNPFQKSDIEIKPSPIHRYGVFAKKDIAPNNLIEECPMILLNKLETGHLNAITTKTFTWDDNTRALALGYGSMYNHAKQPNAEYIVDHQNQTIKFTASDYIPAGTEILIDYGSNYWAAYNKRSLATKLKNDSSCSRIIVFLLLLLGLSIIFPSGLHGLSKDVNASPQFTQILTNPLQQLRLMPNNPHQNSDKAN